MATLLFYQEPVGLNREEHKNLRLKKSSTLGFAKNVNSVPIAGVEFFNASRDFPVAFTKDSEGKMLPVVLLSLKPNTNNLDQASKDTYVPAFIRRYPFALTDSGTVVFDKGAPHLQEAEGDRLFQEENGENTDTLNEIVQFLNQMDQHYKATQEFCKALTEREMFEPFNVQVNLGKEQSIRLGNLSIVSEKKFRELPEADVTEFFKKGWLGWMYAHLYSLNSVVRLAQRDKEAEAKAAESTAD